MGGLIQRVQNTGKGYDFRTLSASMQQLKGALSGQVEAAILAEPDTSYDIPGADHGCRARGENFLRAGARRIVPGDFHRRCAGCDRGAGETGEKVMKLSPLQKRAARHARNKFSVDLNLVSLIDIFTILIFFLLANASEVEVLPSTKA